MGLDMYLTKHSNIGAEYDFNEITGQVRLLKAGKKLPIKMKRIEVITESVGYWRKANQIHKWFVDNVQDGNDDCNKYEVGIDKLKMLVEICKRIKKDHSLAEELLPSQRGFYFGSTEYDEYYYQDIDNTIKQLEPLIKEYDEYPEDSWCKPTFYYQSSW